MLFFQIKKPTFYIIFVFLIIILQGFHTQVQAESTDRRDTARTLFLEGIEAFNEQDHQTTLEKFNNCLTIYRESGDQQSQAGILAGIAEINFYAGRLADCLSYLKESKEIYNKLGIKSGEDGIVNDIDKSIKAVTLLIEGLWYRDGKDYESALKKYKDALLIYSDIDNNEGIIKALYYSGKACLALNDHSKSWACFKRALTLSQKTKDKENEILITMTIGEVYGKKGNFDKSLEYYKQALNIIQEIKNHPSKGHLLYAIGASYAGKGNYEEALKALYKATQIFKVDNYTPSQGAALTLIGEINKTLGKYTEAIDNFQEALALYKISKDSFGQKLAMKALREIYILLGDDEKAREYIMEKKK